MVEAIFEGMCYMHGMCFAMLTPILYISGYRKIHGVARGTGFAHVLIGVLHSARLTLRHI